MFISFVDVIVLLAVVVEVVLIVVVIGLISMFLACLPPRWSSG